MNEIEQTLKNADTESTRSPSGNDHRQGHFLKDIILDSTNKQNIIKIANSTKLTPLTEEQVRLFADRGFTPPRGITRIAKKIIMDMVKKH